MRRLTFTGWAFCFLAPATLSVLNQCFTGDRLYQRQVKSVFIARNEIAPKSLDNSPKQKSTEDQATFTCLPNCVNSE